MSHKPQSGSIMIHNTRSHFRRSSKNIEKHQLLITGVLKLRANFVYCHVRPTFWPIYLEKFEAGSNGTGAISGRRVPILRRIKLGMISHRLL